MHPVLFKIGDFAIHWYGVFMALAFAAALIHWTIIARREGKDVNECSDLMFWMMISGIAGGRLAYVFANWQEYLQEPWRIIKVYEGGLIYYGGFIGATIAGIIFAVVKKKKILDFADFVVTPLPLGHALGRIGCFLNGCCHGSATSCICGVRYPPHSFAWNRQIDLGLIDRFTPKTLPVHPVQLYESFFNIILYLLLIFIYKRRRADGTVIMTYLLLYPTGRFLMEFFRGDERQHIGIFTVAQLFSITLFGIGIGIGVLIYARGRKATI